MTAIQPQRNPPWRDQAKPAPCMSYKPNRPLALAR